MPLFNMHAEPQKNTPKASVAGATLFLRMKHTQSAQQNAAIAQATGNVIRARDANKIPKLKYKVTQKKGLLIYHSTQIVPFILS